MDIQSLLTTVVGRSGRFVLVVDPNWSDAWVYPVSGTLMPVPPIHGQSFFVIVLPAISRPPSEAEAEDIEEALMEADIEGAEAILRKLASR